MNDYVLFDLDGTLTDPKVGITTCVQYALKSFGIEEPNLDKLEPFIGPPLKDSFMEFYGLSEEQSGEATEKYRERFQDIGLYENEIYDGIKKLLKQCKKTGAILGVASSKPGVFVKRILEHFQIAEYFDVVVGSELDGRRTDKGEVIAEALKQLFGGNDIQYDKVVMVGDRKFDIIGARQNGIVSIGVSYGYGDMEELKEAKADFIARTVNELQELLLRGRNKEKSEDQMYKVKEETLTKKILNIVFPLAFYYILTDALRMVLNHLMISIITQFPSETALGLVVTSPDSMNILGFTGDVTALINGISFLTAFLIIYKYMGKAELIQSKFIYDIKHKTKRDNQNKQGLMLQRGLLLVGGIAICIGLNFLFNLTGLIQQSNEFSQVAQRQMAVSLLVGIGLYGVLSPLAEELIFRGVIFNRLKNYFGLKIGIGVSGLIFGLYHGNLIQGIYGALIGWLIAFIYHRSGEFGSAVLLHGIINVTAFLLTYFNVFQTGFYGYASCGIMLIIGIALFVAYWKVGKAWE